MSDQLKPTNDEIVQYIYDWITSVDGYGLVITDEEEIKRFLSTSNFQVLREMFAPDEMYDSIRDYVDKEM